MHVVREDGEKGAVREEDGGIKGCGEEGVVVTEDGAV